MGRSHLPNITIPPPKGESSGGAQSRPDPRHQGALGLSSLRGKGAGVCPPTREFLVTGCQGARGSSQLSVRTRWPQCHLLRARGQPPGTGHAEARGGMYRAGEEIGGDLHDLECLHLCSCSLLAKYLLVTTTAKNPLSSSCRATKIEIYFCGYEYRILRRSQI